VWEGRLEKWVQEEGREELKEADETGRGQGWAADIGISKRKGTVLPTTETRHTSTKETVGQAPYLIYLWTLRRPSRGSEPCLVGELRHPLWRLVEQHLVPLLHAESGKAALLVLRRDTHSA
jgi:hypothetical protein